jgi:hypothetical protein
MNLMTRILARDHKYDERKDLLITSVSTTDLLWTTESQQAGIWQICKVMQILYKMRTVYDFQLMQFSQFNAKPKSGILGLFSFGHDCRNPKVACVFVIQCPLKSILICIEHTHKTHAR